MSKPQNDIPLIREYIEMCQRSHPMSLEDAAIKAAQILPRAAVDQAVSLIREQAKQNQLLKVPRGVTKLQYQRLLEDVRGNQWYSGPNLTTDKHWTPLRNSMVENLGEDVAESVDQASTKIVSLLGDPGINRLSKRGLVVGYVQSGKTANYSAVLAKAADAGFRLFIVLAGVHNSLRSQTQARLDADLIELYRDPWCSLTHVHGDFHKVTEGSGLLASPTLRNLAVVKKNSTRLRNLVEWLESIHENIRASCPAIIIDDEADQATPNTKAAKDEISAINDLTRQVFQLLPSATYIGYTATPFANVLIEPTVEDDLYPADFIIDLPRPDAYFGSEQLFGREPLSEDEDTIDGYDMIRGISDSDQIVPPTRKDKQAGFVLKAPNSLKDAIRWFILTVAARWQRGQKKHTSMLIHTSHLVAQHFDVAQLVKQFVDSIAICENLHSELETLWVVESERVPATLFGRSTVSYRELREFIPGVLDEIKVIIDNGSSQDRLNYSLDNPETVIAVGGATLSRGLTLEGLTVSYFLRNSKTYDTLLQMGRWFGYRVGYEELPRVWLTMEMRQNFRDLATIEQEIREDIRRYSIESVTPRQLGVRIRMHPTMAVTAASKMVAAEKVSISYAGARKQTFQFDKSPQIHEHNLDVTRGLVAAIRDHRCDFTETGSSWLAVDVPDNCVYDFMENYLVASVHKDLQPDLTFNYLKARSDDVASLWNVAVIGSSRRYLIDWNTKEKFEPGTIELGLPAPVQMVNRAPLEGNKQFIDIKALMSNKDRFIDLGISNKEIAGSDDLEQLRVSRSGGRGLLLIYPVSGNSRPTTRGIRTTFEEPVNIIGFGIIFPDHVDENGDVRVNENTYIGLPKRLMKESVGAIDEDLDISMLSEDDEGNSDVDGTDRLGGG